MTNRKSAEGYPPVEVAEVASLKRTFTEIIVELEASRSQDGARSGASLTPNKPYQQVVLDNSKNPEQGPTQAEQPGLLVPRKSTAREGVEATWDKATGLSRFKPERSTMSNVTSPQLAARFARAILELDGNQRTRAELRATAHHEAGHAVADIVLGFIDDIDYVTIKPHVGEDGTLFVGGVHYKQNESTLLPDLTEEQLRILAISIMAGPLAEMRDTRHRNLDKRRADIFGGAESDGQQVNDVCLVLAERTLGVAIREDGYVPSAVRECADALIPQLYDEAVKLVEEHWHNIRALALLLQKQGTVSEAEIWDLLTEAKVSPVEDEEAA